MSKEELIENEVVAEEDQDTQEVLREAFDAAVEAGSTEDEVKMKLIQAGATFKNVTRTYNQFMIDAGFAISKEDRNQIVDETLEGRDLTVEEGFDEGVVALVEAVKGTTERSAGALIRAYCKKSELECYAKPKSEGAGRPGFVKEYYALLVANPSITEEEAKAYILGEGEHADTSENVKRHISHHQGIRKLANDIAAKFK